MIHWQQPTFRVVRRLGRMDKGGIRQDGEEEEDEISELEKTIESANLPEHALKAAKKEMKVSV